MGRSATFGSAVESGGDVDAVLGFIIVAAWICLPFYIAFDAKQHGIKRGQGAGFLDMGPLGWFIVSAVPCFTMYIAWICYFVSRKHLYELAERAANPPPPPLPPPPG